MALIPLKFPAGFYRTGTDLDAAGRWRDGSLVRWKNGSLRPVGGWGTDDRFGTSGDLSINIPRGMHAWQALDGTRYIAAGTYNELKAAITTNLVYDIAPLNLTAGYESPTTEAGYGYGAYGSGLYGRAASAKTVTEATTWSLDNWGEYLVACSTDDGRILELNLSSAEGATLVTNGDFSAGTDWTLGTGWSIGSGVASYSGTATSNALSQSYTGSFAINRPYRISFTFATTSAADVRVKFTGDTELVNETYSAAGTHTVDFIADSVDGTIEFELGTSTGSTEDFTIDDVSIKLQPQAYEIPNSPTNNTGLIVTEERFLFALGAGGNPRKVQWCDREDNTLWAAASTNEAGDIELQTSGEIQTAIRTRGQTLILTTTSAHTARYVGPPYVYGFERVGTSCGVVSKKAAAEVDAGTFWMGRRGFFVFNGNTVTEVPCEVHDYVFDGLSAENASKTWALSNGQFGEIWWFYCSDQSSEIDRYVAYNYKENYWLIGDLSRTCGVERGVFENPLMIDTSGVVQEHELTPSTHGTQDVFAESGPISIGNGDNVMQVMELIPDEETQGEVDVTFKTRFYPNDTEYTHGPYSTANPTSVRFSGRQVRMRVEGQTTELWKVGTMRLEAKTGGRR